MAAEISLLDYADGSGGFALAPFFRGGSPVEGARWGMSLMAAGSMRFRWDEENPVRDGFLSRVLGGRVASAVELVHSKTVVESSRAGDTAGLRADAVATASREVVPVVTVADCVPILLFDPATGARAAVHSGWKGTGIAAACVDFMRSRFGTDPRDVLAAVGPHIGACCYSVDSERRELFAREFGASSVRGSCLSLTGANLAVLARAGVPEGNVVVARECTCCARLASGASAFGSFRRQAAGLPESVGMDGRSRAMTVQAAFVL